MPRSTPAPPEAPTAPLPPPGFEPLRAADGKMLGGVASGLARAAGIDVTLARLAVAAGALTGIVAVAYVVAWVVIPRENPNEGKVIVPAPPHIARGIRIGFTVMAAIGALRALSFGWFPGVWWGDGPFDNRGPFGGVVGIALIAAAVAVILRRKPWQAAAAVSAPVAEPGTAWGVGAAGPPPAPPAPPGGGWQPPLPPALPTPHNTGLTLARVIGWLVAFWFGLAAAVSCAMWAFGALRVHLPVLVGGVTLLAFGTLLYALIRTRSPQFIVAAIAGLLIPATLITATARWNGTVGGRDVQPTSLDEVAAVYEHALGRLRLDLSTLPLTEGRKHIKASVVAGELEVIVPRNVALVVRASATGGELDVLGRSENGMELDVLVRDEGPTANAPVLELDLEVRFGHIVVDRAEDPFAPFDPPAKFPPPTALPEDAPNGQHYDCVIPEGGGPAQCQPR